MLGAARLNVPQALSCSSFEILNLWSWSMVVVFLDLLLFCQEVVVTSALFACYPEQSSFPFTDRTPEIDADQEKCFWPLHSFKQRCPAQHTHCVSFWFETGWRSHEYVSKAGTANVLVLEWLIIYIGGSNGSVSLRHTQMYEQKLCKNSMGFFK